MGDQSHREKEGFTGWVDIPRRGVEWLEALERRSFSATDMDREMVREMLHGMKDEEGRS